MKESAKKNQNNQVHLYGYINDVRINTLEDGRTAINLDVATIENFKDKEEKMQSRRSYHDVAIFTDDKKVVNEFKKIAIDTESNRENRGVEGYKPATHTISMDGILVNKKNAIEGSDKTYDTVYILANEKSIDLDVKQAEKEVRNTAVLTGNVGNIDLHKDKKFAVVSIAHHYRPEGSEKEYMTWLNVRVNGNRKPSAAAYEAIEKGELKKGDFIKVGGQLHNNNFEAQDKTMRFSVSMDLTSFTKLEKKEAKTETVEVKEEPAKKAAPKKAAEKKEIAAKKAVSRKKKGVTMG